MHSSQQYIRPHTRRSCRRRGAAARTAAAATRRGGAWCVGVGGGVWVVCAAINRRGRDMYRDMSRDRDMDTAGTREGHGQEGRGQMCRTRQGHGGDNCTGTKRRRAQGHGTNVQETRRLALHVIAVWLCVVCGSGSFVCAVPYRWQRVASYRCDSVLQV